MFVSIGKAAALFGVSTSTLRRWDKAGKVTPAFRTVGGHRRYQLAMLLEFTKQLAPKKDRTKNRKTTQVPVITYVREIENISGKTAFALGDRVFPKCKSQSSGPGFLDWRL